MSQFIVPLSGLPSISSIAETQKIGAKAVPDNVLFADVLNEAIGNLTATGEASQATMQELAMGGSDDLHTGAVAALKYNTAVSFTSAVASNVVKAYNELLRMSI